MAGDQFSLCWDNFHSNMSSGLSSLLKSEALVDVTLAAEGKYMKAHKMVLSVCSPYFRELFEVNPCQHPIVFLKDVSYNSLSYLMEFMYQGEVRVSQDDLGTFIKTAEALKIKGLTGEGSNQTEAEAEPTKQQSETTQNSSTPTPATRRTAHERSPAPQKKLLGPASKRFRSDVEQQHHMQPDQPEPTPDKHTNSENPIMQFKVEPDDGVIALENDEDGTYDDTGMDDMGMDNSADYLLEPASDAELKEVKAGTSSTTNATDSTGENQGKHKFLVTQIGTLNLILHHHVYRPKNLNEGAGKRTWVCTWSKKHCPAKCISFGSKLVSKIGMHNHPSQRDHIASKEASGQICYRHLF